MMTMISKEEQSRILEEISAYLREQQRFTEQDLLNRYGGDGRDVRLLIWEAREAVRASDGIVFGVIPKWPGAFQRLEWSQIERQAIRQRAAGTRKHARAGSKLRIAATTAPDEAKTRLNDAADRVALRIAMRASKG